MPHDSTPHSTPPLTGATIARLDGVTKRYGEVTALDDVDLTVHAGEVVGLLGPNGAGKTTTVNLLLGLAQATNGSVTTFGNDPRTLATRLRLGAMLQISKVPETLTVREHVHLTSSYYERPLPIDETLQLAGLQGLERRLFGKLSGGQQQRTLFALAICGNPDLLFLDEPTAGLDVEARRELWTCVRRLVDEGKTVLLTTHHLEEADALANRIVVVDRGRIVAEGTPEEIKARTHGRLIRCQSTLSPTEVARWPNVQRVTAEGKRLRIEASRAEPIVARLLDRDPALHDLEVTSAGLEEALLSLTQRPDAVQEAA